MSFYLIPEPYRMKQTEGAFFLKYDTEIVLSSGCSGKEYGYARRLAETIRESAGLSLSIRKGEPTGQNEIYLCLLPEAEEPPKDVRILLEQERGAENWTCPDAETERTWRIRTESYSVSISEESICVEASYTRGILYGVQTLRQLISQLCMVLPCLEIEDAPALANRGFYHDAARGRVRKLEEYKRLAEKLSYYKINQLQLYVEHSYLFRDLTELWRDDTPLTAEEIMELDEYCKNIGIELVPSLASFGHLNKLLQTKQYAHLCELEGSDRERFTFVGRMAHHTINPADEESFELIRKLLLEFMPLFSSRQFNLCGDETFDLGKGRSKALAEAIGPERMYVNFVKKICAVIVENGRRPMFWGDIIVRSPELLKELPESVVCLTWGYSEEEKEDSAKAMDRVGAVQYLCPGVHGWRHLINRLGSAYANISRMCGYAAKYHALGLLNTDWGDYGHIGHPDFSIPGMIYGAEGSWCGKLRPEEEMNQRISRVEYGDRTERVAGLLSELGGQEGAAWEVLVDYMEQMTEGNDLSAEEQKKKFSARIPWEELSQKNQRIRELVKELSEGAENLNGNGKKRLAAYLLFAEGQIIFNRIAETIAASLKKQPVDHAERPPKELAAELERWFQEYKKLWREGCKESELYRIQNVMFWYADLLRDMD
ncbi:MAG: glycoside hydrolase family 20 zincin-like fold domain-containing protein [Lachnospiraceae bacterium]